MPETGAGIQDKSQTLAAFDFDFVHYWYLGDCLDPSSRKKASLDMS